MQPGIYGYGLSYDAPQRVALPLTSAKRLYKTIKENFGTLVFCRRYLERLGCERYLAGVRFISISDLKRRTDAIKAQLSRIEWRSR